LSSYSLCAECEERRKDLAAIEYKLFELERQRDSLKSQVASIPRLKDTIASLESGQCGWASYLRHGAHQMQRSIIAMKSSKLRMTNIKSSKTD
jgi:hypothetical protein